MNETHWFQVSISCRRLETVSINVHKTPVECFECTVAPVDDHPAITTSLTRFSLFTIASTPVSSLRPQSSCYKTANRAQRNTTTRPVARISQQGGQKPQVGAHFSIQYWMYAAAGEPNMKWGAQISNGGQGPLPTPAGDDPDDHHILSVSLLWKTAVTC